MNMKSFNTVQKFHSLWLSFSLKKKLRLLTASLTAASAIAVILAIAVSIFGMSGFSSILRDNYRALNVRSAIEEESRYFSDYILKGSKESKDEYENAAENTAKAVKLLPFDYGKIGRERYAKTWSILSSFESYGKMKAELLSMDKEDTRYVTKLYDIYAVQSYLEKYASRLQQLNEEAGKQRYNKLVPLFIIVPLLTILIGAVAMIILWKLNSSLDRELIKPVLELVKESERITVNDFDGEDIETSGEDEIARLILAFNKMKHSTKDYIYTLKEKHEIERQLEAVRLQLLKNQINPHFLFNTLNTIAGMAQLEDAEVTEKMISAMSRLFRYNLKSTASTMPLEREIKIVNDYMYLQKMRFNDRLRISVQCEPKTLDKLIPSFALQPLVENAIVHGICNKTEGGRICIRSWLDGKKLFISIADTGIGMSEEKQNEVRLALLNGEEDKTGIGLGNIYKRLHTMYEDGELYIYSRQNCGTAVQMSFTVE